MKDWVPIIDWLGREGEPLDPQRLRFKALQSKPDRPGCSGCIFKGQPSIVCTSAAKVARREGLPDCDDVDPNTGNTHVYVLVAPKQTDWVAITD